MSFEHKPVLLTECIETLNIKPDGIYVDGTLGGAGHSIEILKRLNRQGLLIGLDQDAEAIAAAVQRLSDHGRQIHTENNNNLYTYTKEAGTQLTKEKSTSGTKEKRTQLTKDESTSGTKEELPRFMVVRTNFENIKTVLDDLGITQVDGILLDIGVSSHQLDEADRGFSYMQDAPLDMRMDQEAEISAAEILNLSSEKELTRILREYGEEKWAARIAKFIVEARQRQPLTRTSELVEIIKAAIPKGARMEGGHPAKRTFQAIRIAVNRELQVLEQVLEDAVPLLKQGGRICIITFHSLEDRIVKTKFHQLADPCTCPKEFPICVCGKVPMVKLVSRKPITSAEEELLHNSRARSAKLRVAESIYKR